MGRLRPRERENFRSHLTKGEVEEMRRLLKELGDEALDQNFCEKLARKFNCATFRSGKPDIQWKQIQTWFQKKQHACASSNDKADSSPIVSEELVSISEDEFVVTSEDEFVATAKQEIVATAKQEIVASAPKDLIAVPNDSVSNIAPESSIILKGESLPEISDLLFEAKSSKDEAWYDVAYFLAHRVLSSGETEVHVRFVGFGAEEDEWVNVKRAVRERSIPLEPSECQRIQVGDLVLCFQDREDQAIYFDAHIMEIERRSHDIRGCRCLFLVYYDHDKTEEKVRLRRMCRRPSY